MRVLVAAIFGGIVMFLWGALAHTALGMGEPSMQAPANEAVVLNSLHEGFGSHAGVYILPSLDLKDPSAKAAYVAKSGTSPYAWVVYVPQGVDLTDMSRQLPRQWASDTLAALVLAAVMAMAPFSFRRRLGIAAMAAIFAWLSAVIPDSTWYLFPYSFTLSTLLEQLIGWLLAGAAMAWWLGRSVRQA
jgi:hypothetical protein